jgi:hypothetical protein
MVIRVEAGKGALDRESGDRLARPLARKQPFSRMGRLPIIPEMF